MMHLSSWPCRIRIGHIRFLADRSHRGIRSFGHDGNAGGIGMYYTKLMHTFFPGRTDPEYRDMFELAASSTNE